MSLRDLFSGLTDEEFRALVLAVQRGEVSIPVVVEIQTESKN